MASVRSVALTLLLVAFACDDPGVLPPETSRAVYLPMADGTRVAVDVWLPNLAPGQRIPTIMMMTRYWRATRVTGRPVFVDPYFDDPGHITDRGYALVVVDARGSGASFGYRVGEVAPPEVADYREVVDWIVARPWSDGSVGAVGGSYLGATSIALSALGHPAVKAVVPRFFNYDPTAQLFSVGGLWNEAFNRPWTSLTSALDRNDLCGVADLLGLPCSTVVSAFGGPKPVDEDADGSLLGAAVAEHAANVDVYAAARAISYRDDLFGPAELTAAQLSSYGFADAVSAGQVPWYSWVGWLDAATGDGALSAYMTSTNPQRVVIGPWTHGGGDDNDPYDPPDTPVTPSPAAQFQDIMTFFDDYLRGDATAPLTREIRYVTLGEGVWRTTSTWPPPEVAPQVWYLDAAGGLSTNAPSAPTGEDAYAIDWSATTGATNRWHQFSTTGNGLYADRAAEDLKLLTYTSAPLAQAVRITGPVIATFYIRIDDTDGALLAYLEDVDPSGRVTYLTEGALRLVHRAVAADAPYYTFGPYHSGLRADAAPMIPGQVAEVNLAFFSTSALVAAGHRLRIALAAHDAQTFDPVGAATTLTIERNALRPSRVVLPVAP